MSVFETIDGETISGMPSSHDMGIASRFGSECPQVSEAMFVSDLTSDELLIPTFENFTLHERSNITKLTHLTASIRTYSEI